MFARPAEVDTQGFCSFAGDFPQSWSLVHEAGEHQEDLAQLSEVAQFRSLTQGNPVSAGTSHVFSSGAPITG